MVSFSIVTLTLFYIYVECTVSQGMYLPSEHLLSAVNGKIIMSCGSPESEDAAKNLFVPFFVSLFFRLSIINLIFNLAHLTFVLVRILLDVSSLKGGAPGLTRGLGIYEVDPCSEGLEVINKLS